MDTLFICLFFAVSISVIAYFSHNSSSYQKRDGDELDLMKDVE